MTRRRSLFTLVLLAVLVLAGCATNNTGGTPSTSTPSGSTPAASTPAGTTPTSPTLTIRSIKVGTEADYPPFEDTTPDGKIVGFDIDLMTEIGNRTGINVSYQNAQFTAIIPSIQSGQFDAGISAFTITDERKQQVDFSVSYYDNSLMVGVRSGSADINKPEDLQAHKVCTQTGTTSYDYLVAHGQKNESMLLEDHFPDCVPALERGDVDAMMIDRAVVRTLITSSNGQLKKAFEVPTEEQFGIAIAKGKPELLTAINGALVSMKQDGTLQTLADKWQV